MKAVLKKKSAAISLVGILLTLVAACAFLWSPRWMNEHFEALTFDLRFRVRNLFVAPPRPNDILIIAIDEASLESYGRWPWNRDLQARLIRTLLAAEPRVLAVDIFYAEPETPKRDQELAAALAAGTGRLILATGFDLSADEAPPAPDFLIDNALLKIRQFSQLGSILEAGKFKSTLAELYAQPQLGHVVSPPDLDGKLRWEHLVVAYQDEFYPSLSLLAAARAQGHGLEDIALEGNRGISIAEQLLPSDPRGRLRVNYLGEQAFPSISAGQVLDGRVPAEQLQDKVLFLGTTAISTYDFMVTPFSARSPAVEKNATVVENILNQRFITDAPYLAVLLFILVSGILLALVMPAIRALYGVGLALLIMLLFALVNQYLFARHNLYINFIYPFGNLFCISIIFSTYKYFSEEKRAKEMKRVFSSYVSPKIVNELIEHPELARLGGHRQEITVLFSDIRGFTSFSESRQPEEVVSRLNEYLQAMTDIIFRWEGTLDKFVGDEIMAFWGAPSHQPNHAELAMRCALHMSDTLEQMQQQWRAQGQPILDCGIGINTGEVLIGNIGAADKKMDYTIIGDHVNLGARVEALTRKYDTRILVTEFTYQQVTELIAKGIIGHAAVTELDRVQVKGKEIPVTVYGIASLPIEH